MPANEMALPAHFYRQCRLLLILLLIVQTHKLNGKRRFQVSDTEMFYYRGWKVESSKLRGAQKWFVSKMRRSTLSLIPNSLLIHY
jgi:hypothetical protein